MAQAEQTDRSVNLAQAILIALVIIGVVVSIILGLLTLIKNKNDDLNATFDATELAELEPFNNGTVKGSEILALINRKQASDFGVIVVTAKENEWASGRNYLRPIGTAVTDAGSDTNKTPGVYKNTLAGDPTTAADKWAAAQSLTGAFADDGTAAPAINLKFANKSGHKSEILPTAKFDCKLIIDSRKPIGAACVQKGSKLNP